MHLGISRLCGLECRYLGLLCGRHFRPPSPPPPIMSLDTSHCSLCVDSANQRRWVVSPRPATPLLFLLSSLLICHQQLHDTESVSLSLCFSTLSHNQISVSPPLLRGSASAAFSIAPITKVCFLPYMIHPE
ncbi:hypothetical protein LZ31DRAFT_96689 [Colletotrichum somersetense]|nr:hypothetical protein LZ31DRAFT_96689 [Colletotrichum somersetense]